MLGGFGVWRGESGTVRWLVLGLWRGADRESSEFLVGCCPVGCAWMVRTEPDVGGDVLVVDAGVDRADLRDVRCWLAAVLIRLELAVGEGER